MKEEKTEKAGVVDEKKKSLATSKKGLVMKKLDPDSAKLLQQLKDRANKKTHGRKVRDSEILALAIKQITAEHIQSLQEATLSERDRLQIAHEEFQRVNGKISIDQFIGKLLRGEISKSV